MRLQAILCVSTLKMMHTRAWAFRSCNAQMNANFPVTNVYKRDTIFPWHQKWTKRKCKPFTWWNGLRYALTRLLGSWRTFLLESHCCEHDTN
jgi:hypothetical protein